jgi:transposase InsO family protein
VCNQGRLVDPDRRLLDRLEDDRGLAVAALRNAVALRNLDGTTLHSDRGSQFRSGKFIKLLRHEASPGRWAGSAPPDNAAMESFFALLQKNVLDKQRWRSRADLRLAIVDWIERTYHRRRRQRGLGRLTLIEFDNQTSRSRGLKTTNHESQINRKQSRHLLP